MERIIYKYKLGVLTTTRIRCPAISEALTVGYDKDNVLCLWMICIKNSAPVMKTVRVIPTGEGFTDAKLHEYVGSVKELPENELMWHIFVEKHDQKVG